MAQLLRQQQKQQLQSGGTCNKNMQLSLGLRFIRQPYKYISFFRERRGGSVFPATSAECSVAAAFEAGNDAQKQKQHQKLAIWLQQQTKRTLGKIFLGILRFKSFNSVLCDRKKCTLNKNIT